jgi:hypothetical protein
VTIAGIVFWRERTLGFRNAFTEIVIGVVMFFLLSTTYQLWISKVEKGAVYFGGRPDGTKVTITTKAEKHSQNYDVTVVLTDKQGRVLKESTSKGLFSEWFDLNGFIVYANFATWLTKLIPTDTKKTF